MPHSRKSSSFLLAAAPLFLVLFIDSMGLGLVFPILNDLVISQNSPFLSAGVSEGMRNLIYGTTIGLYMFCWFFGAAFLGDLSDQIGRKKSLMICLVGAFIGYFLSAIAIVMSSFSLLLLGRFVAGFTAGSQPIAQAAIVDISTEEHKARNLGLIFLAMSIGFIFGPLASGVLSNKNIMPNFGYQTPFIFAASISLLNAVLLQVYFKETFQRAGKLRFRLHHALDIFVSAFRDEKVSELSLIFLVMIFGWSSFYTFIPMFLLHQFEFNAMHTSLYMGLMGVGFCIGNILIERCVKRFTLRRCVMGGALIAAFCSLLTAMTTNVTFIWLYVIPLTAAISIAYAAMMALFSNQVDQNAQGWVMGITGAIMAFSFGTNGLLVGLLSDYSAYLPLYTTSAVLILSAALMRLLFKNNRVK